MSGLRPVREHQEVILAGIKPLSAIELPLLDCIGLAVTDDVLAPWALPSFDNSSMDGYAVRAADLAGALADHPVALRVIGDLAAGSSSNIAVKPGTCVRIMTGAAMPPGADTVVPVEDTDAGMATVLVFKAAATGAFIRRVGDDVGAGHVVFPAGAEVTARSLGVLASVGCGTLRVARRPRVTVISTGDELVEAGAPIPRGHISESNGLMLTACARRAGAVAERAPIVKDDPLALRAALDKAARNSDLVLTSGGVSMGAYDTVKSVLAASGEVEFVRVALQPGMPQGYGRLAPDGPPIITLPGNPVSSYVSFELFVRPALRRMMGHSQLHRPTIRARLEGSLTSPAGKQQYVRARLEPSGEATVTPVGGPGSHLLGALAVADALIVLPAETTQVGAGEFVEVIDLRDGRA